MWIFKYLFPLLLIFVSCRNNSEDKKMDESKLNEELTRMNRIMVGNESKEIEKFISSHGFHTTMTGTGLRYEIYKSEKGKHPSYQSEVIVNYKLYLLNGTLCYTTVKQGPEKFRLGVGDQVKGLEEVLMLMVPGEKAHAILPAHLGYGMSGLDRKIPPASALYYDVELVDVIQ